MKIIDCDVKGNVVRLHLGDDDLADWGGDDWNDRPYDCNAGPVEDRYVSAVMDVAVPWRFGVLEPKDERVNCEFSRDDMKARRVPMLLVAHPDDWGWTPTWVEAIGDERTTRVYMGDKPDVLLAVPGVVVLDSTENA